MGNVIVGFIRTPEGEAALERAVAEAHLRGARLIVVHASEGGSAEVASDVAADRERLDEISTQLDAEGLEFEVRDVARGRTPAEELVGAVGDAAEDLIVIGIRRRTPVGKLLLGSQAQRTLMLAECAVLAVRPGPGQGLLGD